MRRIAISDIHGCLDSFKALLQKIELTTADALFLLGDYIDKGPYSKEVIDYIWHLQETGYTVHCLLGNHEQMLLEEYHPRESIYKVYPEALRSFEVQHVREIPEKYIGWMEELDSYLEIEGYILVHAGLSFKNANPLADAKSMIWIRNWQDSIDKKWLAGRKIVHGHTPLHKEKIIKSLTKLEETPAINIDGGCWFTYEGMGNLCALDLDELTVTFQERLEVMAIKKK